MRFPPLLPWVVRGLWATLPVTLGPAVADALDSRSTAVRTTASVGLWAVWAVVVVATLVPHPLALTALRVAAPGAVLVAFLAEPSALATGAAVAVCGIALLPETAMPFVNGPAYPNERRYPLRPPGPLLLGTLEVAWFLAVALPAGGALLLAARQWVVGAVVLAVGLPSAALLLRALHGLSRRWVVFVPAGIVLHDPIALTDPVLFQRKTTASLRLAAADTDSLDLTKGAFGPAVELELTEKVPMVLTTPGRSAGEAGASARLLFAPTRPGAVLAEAERRRLPVDQ